MESNPYLRIMSACFCGGALTFLALALFTPTIGGLATIGITIAGALCGYILAAPIKFVRSIPRAIHASAPTLLNLLGIVMAFVIMAVDTVRDLLTPRPVSWIAHGIPAFYVACVFTSQVGLPDTAFALGVHIYASTLIFLLAYVLFVIPYAILVVVSWSLTDRFDETKGMNTKDGPILSYWRKRFDKELSARGKVLGRHEELCFTKISWTTAMVYLLDLTIGNFIRILRLVGKNVYRLSAAACRILFIEIPRSIWTLFRLVHSDIRLICMLDTPLGALSVYAVLTFVYGIEGPALAGYCVLGGLASLILGALNYGLIAKHWLGLFPAPSPVPQD